MAWLEQHPTSGHFKLCFRWSGKKLKKTLKTTSRKEADAALHRLEENISLLERGRLELPPGADLTTFLLSDGKLAERPKLVAVPKVLTLGELCEDYLRTLANGSMESNSLLTVRIHLNHIRRHFGEKFTIQQLTGGELQAYLDGRIRRRGRKSVPLSPATLKKELASLRACWNWAVQMGKLSGSFPNRGLRFPKGNEKPPFQTRDEIERRIKRGGLSEDEQQALWDCLFLRQSEVQELLEFVEQTHPSEAWLYPMMFMAGHTGARRSELLRVQIDDVDFSGRTILLHEKKRTKGRRSSRRVPLSEPLEMVLRGWLRVHPGGQFLFAQPSSGEAEHATKPLTVNEAHDHFKRTLANSKWSVLRGWHVLRHSFASCLAGAGVDQ